MAKSLFKYLVVNHIREVPAEHLVDLFFPDHSLSEARPILHQAVSVMRSVLEPDIAPKGTSAYIKTCDGRYRLSMPEDSFVDIFTFEKHCLDAALARHDHDHGQAIDYYSQAIDLYRGDFLEAERDDRWASTYRVKYESLYTMALHEVANHALDKGAWSSCVTLTRKILEKEPGDESAYLMLIRSFLAQGKRVNAIKAYLECEHVLNTEYDIQPTKELRDIYSRITDS